MNNESSPARPRRTVRWLWLPVLVAAATAAWLYTTWHTHAQAPASKGSPRTMAVAVAAVAARLSDIPVYLDGLGSVTPLYTVTVRTRVDGQLDQIYYREGEEVMPGVLLAEIDPRPFQVQLEQAEGQMARDQALLANAHVDLERYRTLLGEDAIPKQQFDTQGALLGQYEGAVKTDQAAIDNAKLQLTYCRITAPIGGRIGLRLVDPGNMVHASDTNGLLVITQVRPITVVFTLPEDSLPPVLRKLRGGASLAVDAYNRDRSKKLATGHLLTTDNEIDSSTGTLKLKAEFENRDGTLFPNQFVNVRLLVERMRGQVVVPSVSIQHGALGAFVYVIKHDDTAEARPVTLGTVEGNDTAVAHGLAAGEAVVTEGAERLQPGSRVSLRSEPAASPTSSSGSGLQPGRATNSGN